MQVYAELKAWQGAIGSVLGFMALFLGALWNFHLNRRRDARLRNEEVASIAAALYGELLLIRKAVGQLAARYSAHYLDVGIGRSKRQIDSYFVDETRLPEPQLYNALAPKIGMLPPDVALAIVQFHSNARQAQAYLLRMMPDAQRGYTYSPLHVLEPARRAVVDVAPALARLAQIASVPQADHVVSLGETDLVIDMSTHNDED